MELKSYSIHHLVKSEDLNHHGTLFAGRTAEWFVEAGFVAAANLVDAKDIICLKIHGMQFSKPIKAGNIVYFNSKIVFAGRTSLVAYVRVNLIHHKEIPVVEGFLTFVHVDEESKASPHGITIAPETEEDILLNQQAKELVKVKKAIEHVKQ